MSSPDREKELNRLNKRLERERKARLEAEAIAERGIRELYEKQQEIELLQAITVAANTADSVESAMRTALERVCTHTGWPVGHVYLIAEGGELHSTDIWHYDNHERLAEFKKGTEAIHLDKGEGLPGQVQELSAPICIVDVTKDQNFPRARYAAKAGVVGGFGFPVMVGDEVVAVLEFFSHEQAEPDERLLKILSYIGTQLGRVMERARAQQRLQLTAAQLEESNRELARSEKRALEASRAKSSFLANMSHELRTPLNAILGFVQLMERDPALSREQRENLAIITRSGEHLLNLINDVLSLSKIEAGQMSLHEQTFDLERLLQTLEEMFEMRAQSKNLQLLFDIAPGLPKYVWGDEGKLRQVLINLLSNAVKFTETGGVCLRAGWQDGRLAVEVEDTGQGIAEHEQAATFEAFVQTESGMRAKEGTGLGLAISKNFVRLMGGDITLKSEVGRGSTFSFSVNLPVSTATEADFDRGKVIGIEPGQREHRILIVDDKVENRLLLSKLLQAVGLQVREAADGREAIKVWSQWAPDLIWMDMRMPVMDGYTATKSIRAYERHEIDGEIAGIKIENNNLRDAHVLILALTASAFEHERSAILSAGCDDFVAKPFREQTIFEKMTEHLGLRFIYESPRKVVAAHAKEESALTPARLGALPAELVRALNESVVEGDVAAAHLVIERIGGNDAQLAGELKNLVKSYRFDEIQEIIEQL